MMAMNLLTNAVGNLIDVFVVALLEGAFGSLVKSFGAFY